jgi:hypothetical protein
MDQAALKKKEVKQPVLSTAHALLWIENTKCQVNVAGVFVLKTKDSVPVLVKSAGPQLQCMWEGAEMIPLWWFLLWAGLEKLRKGYRGGHYLFFVYFKII